jgi:hypothetical protein
VAVSTRWISLDEALARNAGEFEDHIYSQLLTIGHDRIKESLYVQEVQMKRHGHSLAESLARAEKFLRLAESIEVKGIRRPVFVADVSDFDLPYELFRFDGHHRCVCAKHLGATRVPAFVFKARRIEGSRAF